MGLYKTQHIQRVTADNWKQKADYFRKSLTDVQNTHIEHSDITSFTQNTEIAKIFNFAEVTSRQNSQEV